jgi:hypothetical protein
MALSDKARVAPETAAARKAGEYVRGMRKKWRHCPAPCSKLPTDAENADAQSIVSD